MTTNARHSPNPKASSARAGRASISIVSSRNQVTLPADVRTAAGIKAGSNVVITPLSGGRILIREKSGRIGDLRGAVLGTASKRTR